MKWEVKHQLGARHPPKHPKCAAKSWCLYFSHSLQSQFSQCPILLLSWTGIFFTELIFLPFTELHELIKESDKHQTCTKKAAWLEAEASFWYQQSFRFGSAAWWYHSLRLVSAVKSGGLTTLLRSLRTSLTFATLFSVFEKCRKKGIMRAVL